MESLINYWAVAGAAVAGTAIGALWYSPFVFGKLWMKLSGLTEAKLVEQKSKGMGRSYVITFFGLLAMSFVLANFSVIWGASGTAAAFSLAFWTWLGFVAPVLLGTVLWEGRPWGLYFLNIAHYFVVLFAMTIVLVYWV